MFQLTQQVLWELTLQSPSIPTMLSTFPTFILLIMTSSTPPVQAFAHLQSIGTMPPLTQQVMWERGLQSPSIPTMMSTFPTMMPTRTSSTLPVQAVVHPQAIGTMFQLTQQVLWDCTLQSPSIPTMLSTFPTLIPPMVTSNLPTIKTQTSTKCWIKTMHVRTTTEPAPKTALAALTPTVMDGRT